MYKRQVDETFYNRPFWYRTEFELPSSYSEGKRVWLHFDNTNRFADFYFNGEKISGTKTSTKDVSGHMLRSKFDVTNLIKKSGKNVIAVLITEDVYKRQIYNYKSKVKRMSTLDSNIFEEEVKMLGSLSQK